MLAKTRAQLATDGELNVDVTNTSGLLLHRVYASAAAKSQLKHRW
ncbi:hypothetical protein OCOJLMKI_4571 [Methylobacterium iners]|uniref:Uncharacterized protein n=1 Tax=Methylobacterium iners TaxID=418707 RepID=A0ABQ4S4J2_9HYPH|nr:hypothetical protein [Methylobacterium iners]GJD97342.1 hypothetical protein OCOJLMKI_4571 [Methylobacterium iners]